MKHKFAKTAAGLQRGFTLIEIMVVVSIVGILVAIAVPSYQDSVRKSRRAQAKSDLVEVAQAMERYYNANGSSYIGANLATIWAAQSPKQGTASYNLSFDGAVTSSTYKIQAAPVAGGGQLRDPCGTMSIDNVGRKTPTNPPECWNMN